MNTDPSRCTFEGMCYLCNTGGHCTVDDGFECCYDSRTNTEKQKFSSEDLILLAHDEWKRREERKHIHDEIPWTVGFLNGFCTSKRWARGYIDKLRRGRI